MPQLKWDETEFIECLEVVPEVAEYQTQHIFTVARHGLTLTITIWQLESMVTLALRRDGQTLLLTQFTLAIRGDVSLQRHKSGDYLEFRDCVFCPGRFSYIHGPGDPSDTACFGVFACCSRRCRTGDSDSFFGGSAMTDFTHQRPNRALQRTRPSRYGCNRTPSWAGSLTYIGSLGNA
jgi:hypothetical protein